MARSVSEVLAMAQEFHSPEVSRLEVFYGPRGGRHTRQSARWHELLSALHEDRVFRCSCCGEMVSYGDLEAWACDFDDLEEGCLCGVCYEDEMGDDL